MLQEKKSKRGAWIALGCVAALLALVIVLENTMQPTSMLFTVLKKGAVYALVAASLNLLNGFTGLFSLGQAGFMLLGAYTYAILTIPTAARESVYYIYQGSAVNFSLPELFGGGAAGLVLGVLGGTFALGTFTKVANAKGAYVAFFVAAVTMVCIKYMAPAGSVSIWSYSIISIAISLVVGIPVSMITRKMDGDTSKPVKDATIYHN